MVIEAEGKGTLWAAEAMGEVAVVRMAREDFPVEVVNGEVWKCRNAPCENMTIS